MLKTKKVLILGLLLLVLLIVPTMVNAATEYTYSDTKQGIEWSYELDDGGSVINLRCKTTSVIGNITIPSTIDGKKVISLGGGYSSGAFKNCAGVTGITIPNTIIKIGSYAFENCTGLKTVEIPDSVTSIGDDAFSECTGLTSITLSKKLTSIGSFAFDGCTGLKSISIPDSVTTIGDGAFRSCSGLKELKLSEHLTKISKRAFSRCSGLTSVILPKSVTTIEGGSSGVEGAFEDCKNLTKILIPDTVASIGKGAFYGCDKLTIYGNDGQTSKEYAEANDINFDYIANWNKANSGADITPPTVESIEVPWLNINAYYQVESNTYKIPANGEIPIDVVFSEEIKATTVPTLTIRFGEGKNITLNNGVINGSDITYVYKVTSTDVGMLSSVSLTGGNITDKAGNPATLSCPALHENLFASRIIYAIGNETTTNNTTNKPSDSNNNTNNNTNKPSDSNNNTNNNTNKPSNNNTNNNKPSNNTQNTDKDNTKAPTKLPQTGEGIMIMLAVVTIAGIGVFAYMKYNKYRDI